MILSLPLSLDLPEPCPSPMWHYTALLPSGCTHSPGSHRPRFAVSRPDPAKLVPYLPCLQFTGRGQSGAHADKALRWEVGPKLSPDRMQGTCKQQPIAWLKVPSLSLCAFWAPDATTGSICELVSNRAVACWAAARAAKMRKLHVRW